MRLKSKSKHRLDQLYRDRYQQVFAVAMRFSGGNREWARDRAQDVFVTLAGELDKLRDQDDLGGWLHRVTRNTCLMQLRRERTLARVNESLSAVGTTVDDGMQRWVQARRDTARLRRRVQQLPSIEQKILRLLYGQDKSQSEAAQDLRISKGYASKRHQRARQSLLNYEWELGLGESAMAH